MKGYKETDGKISYVDLPFNALTEVAKRFKSFDKYPRGNYLKPLENTALLDSIMRHLIAYINGEDLDGTTSHLAAIAANALMLEEQRLAGILIENRLSIIQQEEHLKQLIKDGYDKESNQTK